MNLEMACAKEFLKKLQYKEEDIIDHLTTHTLAHEEYITSVGYLRALRELRSVYTDLIKAYFPNN